MAIVVPGRMAQGARTKLIKLPAPGHWDSDHCMARRAEVAGMELNACA